MLHSIVEAKSMVYVPSMGAAWMNTMSSTCVLRISHCLRRCTDAITLFVAFLAGGSGETPRFRRAVNGPNKADDDGDLEHSFRRGIPTAPTHGCTLPALTR